MRSLISHLLPVLAGAALFACSSSSRSSPNPAPPSVAPAPRIASQAPVVLTGQAAMGDWTTDAPGVRRKLTPGDLPAPYATTSIANGATIVPRPAGVLPQVPKGFVVDLLTTDVEEIGSSKNGPWPGLSSL